MPSLQEITAAHSQRLSALHRRRDQALGEAQSTRDAELRGLPAAAVLYAKFDKAVGDAQDDRMQAAHKAAAVRASALARAVDTRSVALDAAHASRRAADVDALDGKVQAVASAERKYRDAISVLSSIAALEVRQKTRREAEAARQRELDDADHDYRTATAAAQHSYRSAIDGAVSGERHAERAAEQAYAAAERVAAASEAAALAAAERELFRGLQAIPAARDAVQRYQVAVTRIRDDAALEEQRLFQQFREQLHRLGTAPSAS